MNRRTVLIAIILVALFGTAGWYGWRWYTTPAVPTVDLDGVSPEKVEKIREALDAVRQQRRSGKAWGQLGLTLLANGFPNEADPCFVNAARFDPTEPRWLYFQGTVAITFGRRDGFDKLRSALALANTSKTRRIVLFALARALVEDGQLDEAEKHAQEIRAIDGDTPEVAFVLGTVAVARGDRDDARTHLSRLTDHPSARKRACALLVALVADNEQLAREYRRRALELPDDRPWPDSFESELERYFAKAPNPLAPYLALQAQGRNDEALATLQQLAAQSPGEQVCMALGYALIAANRFEEALKPLRQAIGFNPRKAKAHLFLGGALLELGEAKLREGKPDQAAGYFREAVAAEDAAIDLQTDLADAHLTRGRALTRLGRTPDAIAAFRQAARVGAEYAEMHQALGEALAESGQVKEGLEHLENAVRLAKPGDTRPRDALEKWKPKAKSP